MRLGNHCTDLDLRVVGVSHGKFLGLGNQIIAELLVDRVLDIKSGPTQADLALVGKSGSNGGCQGFFILGNFGCEQFPFPREFGQALARVSLGGGKKGPGK